MPDNVPIELVLAVWLAFGIWALGRWEGWWEHLRTKNKRKK